MTKEEAAGYELDAIGILDGVDKASIRGEIPAAWDYLRHYADALHEFRHQEVNIIEIGVAEGASLATWLKFFTRAHIVGVDIDPRCTRFGGGRAEVRIGSQDDPAFLRQVASEAPPTIVIDDGSHIAEHIAVSFETLFPLLAPGGVYAIEDLAFHYFIDASPGSSHSEEEAAIKAAPVRKLLGDLVAARLGHVTFLDRVGEARSKVYGEVDEVRIVGGLAIIRKRKPRDVDRTAKLIEERIESDPIRNRGADYARGCFRLAEYLLTYGRAERALMHANRGIMLFPDDPYGMRVRRAALLKVGRLRSAESVAKALAARGLSADLEAAHRPPQMGYPHL